MNTDILWIAASFVPGLFVIAAGIRRRRVDDKVVRLAAAFTGTEGPDSVVGEVQLVCACGGYWAADPFQYGALIHKHPACAAFRDLTRIRFIDHQQQRLD